MSGRKGTYHIVVEAVEGVCSDVVNSKLKFLLSQDLELDCLRKSDLCLQDLLFELWGVVDLKDSDLLLSDLNIGLVVAVEQVPAVAEVLSAGYEGTGRPVDTTRSRCYGFSCFDILLRSREELGCCDS